MLLRNGTKRQMIGKVHASPQLYLFLKVTELCAWGMERLDYYVLNGSNPIPIDKKIINKISYETQLLSPIIIF